MPDTDVLDTKPIQLTSDEERALKTLRELDETPLESFATVYSFEHVPELLACFHSPPLNSHEWAFRGHANAVWKLETSIERLQHTYPKTFRREAERYVRQTFKHRARHYLQQTPHDGEELEWLALMRHHGAPTRLLDWTKSPYVGAFFAIAEAREDAPSAIWAINVTAIQAEAIRLLEIHGVIGGSGSMDVSLSTADVFEKVFMGVTSPAIVAPVEPASTNERALSQQGLFLCPNNVMPWGFELGLKQVLKSEREYVEEWYSKRYPMKEPVWPESLFKLQIAPQMRAALIKELYRMNISYATLFPGLDGLARSLGTNVTCSDRAVDLDSGLIV